MCDPATGERIDDGLAAYFFAPRSFTGEDLVEFHVHGGPGVLQASLAAVLQAGARLAPPGEFTRRAFANGRIDLAQAEAVADIIAAESERAARAAVHRLEGELGNALRGLRTQLLDRLVEIEAHLDYPDEVPEPDVAALCATIEAQRVCVRDLLQGSSGARALQDGVVCVIAGPPNAGKSSLLNALLRSERAIVSPLAGTTRDVIEDRLTIEGVPVRLFDTAGLRPTHDVIESEGVRRAEQAIDRAQLVILVMDASQALGQDGLAALAQTANTTRVVLANKLDAADRGLSALREALGSQGEQPAQRYIEGSVHWPQTIHGVRAAIAALGWGGSVDPNRALVANARQMQALMRAQVSLNSVLEGLAARHPIDLICIDLRDALEAYGEVTGDTVTEQVLDGIFSRFCVGK